MMISRLIATGLIYAQFINAFYLSTWAPNFLKKGDAVDLKYNKVFSDSSQIPFAYVDLPFVCHPDNQNFDPLNLGEIFSGDRIIKSGQSLSALKDSKCRVLCEKKLSLDEIQQAKRLISENYRVEWFLDGLPGAVIDPELEDAYDVGFLIGQYDPDEEKFYLNNHFEITVQYQNKKSTTGEDRYLITGFFVYAKSVNIQSEDCLESEQVDTKSMVALDQDFLNVVYSYSINWKENSNVEWSNRWDIYIDQTNSKIHWYSIINSLMLLVVLTVIVAFIMLATLRKDIASYNDDDEESQDDIIGWKMVHGDVFRTPRRIGHLAAFVGCGVQLFVSMASTLVFALLGILNPSYRGGLFSYALFFWALSGIFAGYFSARILRSFKGGKNSWQLNAVWTATVFPLILFVSLCILNTFNWALKSSYALPAGTFFALIAIWLFISVPLVLLGAYFGNKKSPIEHPVRTNQIPRQIPEQSIYFKTFPSIAIGGVIPFTIIFMELFFIMKSMWQDQYYYMYGFLALVVLLLIICCVEVTVVLIYFQLCGEDYRWHWKSFIVSSSSTWYILAFGIIQYVMKSNHVTNYMTGVIYFSNLLIGLSAYFLMTGMIGFWSCYIFLRKIYGSIKID